MTFLTIKDAMTQSSGEVKLHGWVYRSRGSSKFRFVVLRDSTNIIQCVIDKSVVGDDKFSIADKLQLESSIEIYGQINKEERAPSGYEIQVSDFNVVNLCKDFPINKGDETTEFLADNRHLALRSRKNVAIMKIRSTVFGAIHGFFRSEGFFEHQSPIFQSSQAEGGSTLFEVNYFGKPLYLAQTWQLHAEAMIFALEKIYCIAPSFRAERSKTSRHLTEYWHAEMEVAWSKFEDIQDYGERLIKYVFSKVLETNLEELKIIERDVSKLLPIVEKPFLKMTYDEALKILKEKCNIDVEWGKDLRTIEEEALTKLYDVPIICSNYPKIVKAFYMKEVPGNSDVVQGCDFLAPEGYGEVIGGSQREEDIEKIEKRLLEQGETLDAYKFYLDTRRYGSVPHGGFGLGVERIITWICGLDNIKDSIAFPRTMLRYTP
ncbi:asparagine--tRNA ligase [Candidatus Woesearchaeota archaeon]|nr:asparagine--tRNA ligase [Candidatus Woesearchaeota archaeon]